MEEYQYDKFTGYGMMPSGEVRWFACESDYCAAYMLEENEMYDEMCRLNNFFEIEDDSLEYA